MAKARKVASRALNSISRMFQKGSNRLEKISQNPRINEFNRGALQNLGNDYAKQLGWYESQLRAVQRTKQYVPNKQSKKEENANGAKKALFE